MRFCVTVLQIYKVLFGFLIAMNSNESVQFYNGGQVRNTVLFNTTSPSAADPPFLLFPRCTFYHGYKKAHL